MIDVFKRFKLFLLILFAVIAFWIIATVDVLVNKFKGKNKLL